MQGGNDFEPLIRTKLHPPRLGRTFVSRPRLNELLSYEPDVPLLLISAPAGYGKSTAAAAWLESQPHPYAWLSLDEDDNNVRSFLRYFIAAVRSVSPGACQRTENTLGASALPPVKTLARQFGDELDEIAETVIVALDDYHRIQSANISEFITELLRYPPQSFQMVIVSRCDPGLPLARLRASGAMTEVRLGELQFSLGETAELVKKGSDRHISSSRLQKLHRTTEGWVVGVQLFIMSLREKEDPDEFVQGLSSDVRFVQDYLLDEVLLQQPPAMQQHLLFSAVVDRICAPLCNALMDSEKTTGELKASCEEILSLQEQMNLFVIPLDDNGEWFRYHHLFQDMLRRKMEEELSPKEVQKLHLKASAWFSENGYIDESIHHALASGELIVAAELIEKHRRDVLNSDDWFLFEKWLSLLPEEIIHQRPLLLLSQAYVLGENFQFTALDRVLDQIDELVASSSPGDALRGEMSFNRGYSLFFQNEPAQALEYFYSALRFLPEKDQLTRGACEMMLGIAHHMAGEKEIGFQRLNEVLSSPKEVSPVRKTRVLASFVFAHITNGDLFHASAVNEQLGRVATEGNYPHVLAWSSYLRGLIHYYRNELDAAILGFLETERRSYAVNIYTVLDALAGLVFSYNAKGEVDEADAALDRLSQHAASADEVSWRPYAESCRARLRLMRQEEAPDYLNYSLGTDGRPQAMLFFLEVPALTECRVLIAKGTDRSLEEASEKLNRFLQANEDTHNVSKMIDILTLLTVLKIKRGEKQEALQCLEQALVLSQPSGWIRPLVEVGDVIKEYLHHLTYKGSLLKHIDCILNVLGESSHSRVEALSNSSKKPLALFEELTWRESEVLELLDERLRTKEIAEKLKVSPATIKSHLKAIYQKLAVNGRREAVAKGHELGLLRTYRPF